MTIEEIELNLKNIFFMNGCAYYYNEENNQFYKLLNENEVKEKCKRSEI